jgi:hypothetical protein
VAQIDQLDRMPRLLRALAEHSGQLIDHSAVGAPFNLNHVTTQRDLALATMAGLGLVMLSFLLVP